MLEKTRAYAHQFNSVQLGYPLNPFSTKRESQLCTSQVVELMPRGLEEQFRSQVMRGLMCYQQAVAKLSLMD